MSPYDDELRALLDEGRTLGSEPPPAPEVRTRPTKARDLRVGDEEADADVAAVSAPPRPQGATGPRGRPSVALQDTWIDPEETPFTPVVRPGKELPARLFSLCVLGAVLAFLAWMILPEVSFRVGNIDNVGVRNGVLTAQPVPLASPSPAVVEELWVDPANPPTGLLEAGTLIARLRTVTVDGDGSSTSTITMPFDGRIASIDTLTGAVTLPETPVVTVYDPAHMYVVVTVRPSTLRRLKEGMRARLTSALVDGSIRGTVVSAVPALGDVYELAESDLVNVRIRPDADAVAELVPGIHFDASIDVTSAPDGAEPLVVAGSSGGS